MRNEIIKKLTDHLRWVESMPDAFYIRKLKQTITKVESNDYLEEDDLLVDLISLGFPDLARQLKADRYL